MKIINNFVRPHLTIFGVRAAAVDAVIPQDVVVAVEIAVTLSLFDGFLFLFPPATRDIAAQAEEEDSEDAQPDEKSHEEPAVIKPLRTI